MEERGVQKVHKLSLNQRKSGSVTGVTDVLSFDLNEVMLETAQGLLTLKGSDLHINCLSVEKGEVDFSGNIDSVTYSEMHKNKVKNENLFAKFFK